MLFIAIVYNVIDLIRISADIERKLHELNSNYNFVTWSLFFYNRWRFQFINWNKIKVKWIVNERATNRGIVIKPLLNMSFFYVSQPSFDSYFVLPYRNIYNAYILDNGFKFRIIQYGWFKAAVQSGFISCFVKQWLTSRQLC